MLLEDEDVKEQIQLELLKKSKNGYIQAEDIVDIMATLQIKEILGDQHCNISVWTAQQWLKSIVWLYGCKQNRMYIDSLERPDVMEY